MFYDIKTYLKIVMGWKIKRKAEVHNFLRFVANAALKILQRSH